MNIGGKWDGTPYAYFNEHCIFLDQIHEPMVNQQTLINLLKSSRPSPLHGRVVLTNRRRLLLSHEHYQVAATASR